MQRIKPLILETQVHFSPQSKGMSSNGLVDYKTDFCRTVGSIIGLTTSKVQSLILKDITIPDANTMHVQFVYKEHYFEITLEKTTRWIGAQAWKGTIIIDDDAFKFPPSIQEYKKNQEYSIDKSRTSTEIIKRL